ncbi:MAG: tRNA 2-thiouridine(34) synthase MnmA [Minisyncoccia bacterium]
MLSKIFKKQNIQNKKVFVGMSGGVDSSVSAALLIDAGYDVTGVFIRTWQPDFIQCTWRDERRDAIRVCAHLGIPFLECDGEATYRDAVAMYMINEYKNGRVPNPDVMCNREVKFGVFWEFAQAHGADYIATGHYAQINQKPQVLNTWEFTRCSAPGETRLIRGVDPAKDQSYFLWTLTNDDLAHTLFPVGHLPKSEVRKLAEKYNIPVATKKDSQGVCFLGEIDMKEFLQHYIKTENGNVLDTTGKVIGHHDGALLYTLGERHGFTITEKTDHDKRYYVVAKDIPNNTITVSDKQNETVGQSTYIPIIRTIWRSNILIQNTYTANIRYHGENLPCKIELKNETEAVIVFENPVLVAPGQSIVVYSGEVCIGGGIVA